MFDSLVVAIAYGLAIMVAALIIIVELLLVFGPAIGLATQVYGINRKIQEVNLTRQVRYPYDTRPEVKDLVKMRRLAFILWTPVALVCWYFGFGPYLHFLQSLNWHALV